MCGIMGGVGPQFETLIEDLNRLQSHRGPDDSGVFEDPAKDVYLAMRRLSILDLDGGHQPMSDAEGKIWIVFNGEIYNSPELRNWLEREGYSLKSSHSDTECLIYLYKHMGSEMLNQLNGMFAFVIYDQQEGLLFGARDRFGIKPLHYYEGDGHFCFSSELKTLINLPGFSREINTSSLSHYLGLRYIPGRDTIFAGANRIPPCMDYCNV